MKTIYTQTDENLAMIPQKRMVFGHMPDLANGLQNLFKFEFF